MVKIGAGQRIISVHDHDEGTVVADGLTMEILEDEKLLEEHGLEKP